MPACMPHFPACAFSHGMSTACAYSMRIRMTCRRPLPSACAPPHAQRRCLFQCCPVQSSTAFALLARISFPFSTSPAASTTWSLRRRRRWRRCRIVARRFAVVAERARVARAALACKEFKARLLTLNHNATCRRKRPVRWQTVLVLMRRKALMVPSRGRLELLNFCL